MLLYCVLIAFGICLAGRFISLYLHLLKIKSLEEIKFTENLPYSPGQAFSVKASIYMYALCTLAFTGALAWEIAVIQFVLFLTGHCFVFSFVF